MHYESQFEIYYFNIKMNYYEPFVEKTTLKVSLIKNSQNKFDLSIHFFKTMNINFSVALFDTVFQLSKTI